MSEPWAAWTPEDEGPAMPVTSMLLAGGRGEQVPGAVLEQALARSRAEDAREARAAAAAAVDPDERAAGLVACGVMPGMISDLSRQLGDAQAELQGEREKIERGRRRTERAMRDHAAGRITAFDIARMDFDEGDPGKVARLERRVASLRRDLEDVSELVSPQRQAPADPLEAASSVESAGALRSSGLAAYGVKPRAPVKPRRARGCTSLAPQ